LKSLKKGFANFIGRIFHSRHVLVFVNGFLLASLLYFYSEDAYENKVFEALGEYVKEKAAAANNKEEALLLNSLHLTYNLAENRATVFGNKEIHTLKSSLIHPVTDDLMTTNGACGSYSYILSRLLNELKIPNRIGQMKVDGLYGGHILVEAKTSKGWVVLDGSYDLYFKKPDGSMASFNDIKNDWAFYHNQVPANYDNRYRYEDVRYTNWNKIPVVMPVIKGFLTMALGKELANSFSFRTFVLRKFHLLFEATIGIYLLILLLVFRRYLQRNRNTIKKYLSFIIPGMKPVLIISAKPERKVA
jgi:hypothetical protein